MTSGMPQQLASDHVPAQKKGGIDYSKFNNIEDSDDEKPNVASKDAVKPPAEKPHCQNCHKDITKPLRCGVCKKVEYCSAKCQKEDWQFHKRVCKKPEEPKPKAKAESREKAQPKAGATETKRREEETVVEDDEKLTWYRHREWKPTAEAKKDFTPQQISEQATASVRADDAAKPAAGSAWNKAGTWEDKDVTEYAKSTIKDRLEACQVSIDVAGGSLTVEGIDDVEGEASKPVIRGRQRHMFDLGFRVKFCFKWMDSDGQRKAEGHIKVSDFTNDTFADGVMSAPCLELKFKDAKALDAPRRQAVEVGLGAGVWPSPGKTLMALIADKMQAWDSEYKQEV